MQRLTTAILQNALSLIGQITVNQLEHLHVNWAGSQPVSNTKGYSTRCMMSAGRKPYKDTCLYYRIQAENQPNRIRRL